MVKVTAPKINLDGFTKTYNRFQDAIKEETAIALVKTRQDFLRRVASILGTVSEAGGDVPSPYVMVYRKLSISWVTYKRKFGLRMPIGVATGETQNWLEGFADDPGLVVQQGRLLEIDAGVPDDGREDTPAGKIYAMEFGYVPSKQPARPIFKPVVVWYLANQADNPFYYEMQAALHRAVTRVYGA